MKGSATCLTEVRAEVSCCLIVCTKSCLYAREMAKRPLELKEEESACDLIVSNKVHVKENCVVLDALSYAAACALCRK